MAAVVAGIVTGQGAARWFTPEQRLSDELNWRTIELVLEGAVFLLMGLELKDIVDEIAKDHDGIGAGHRARCGARSASSSSSVRPTSRCWSGCRAAAPGASSAGGSRS